MKKTLLSLSAIALLASCGGNNNGALNPCNETIAIATAASILETQETDENHELEYQYGAPNFFGNYISSTSMRKCNFTIEETETSDTVTENGDKTSYVFTRKKVFNFDFDRLCAQIDEHTTSEYSYGYKTQTNSTKYLFFIPYEEQEKDTIDTEKVGIAYMLANAGGYKRCLNKVTDLRLSYGISDWQDNFLDDYMYYFIRDGFSDSGYYNTDSFSSGDCAYQTNLLINFYANVEQWSELHAERLIDDNDDTYFNVVYGSNDIHSLSYDIDEQGQIKGKDEETGIEMIMTQGSKRYVEFRNAYVNKVDYTRSFSEQIKSGNTVITSTTSTYTLKRQHNYGTSNCTIPTDIENYL